MVQIQPTGQFLCVTNLYLSNDINNTSIYFKYNIGMQAVCQLQKIS